MSSAAGSVERIAIELAKLLQPLTLYGTPDRTKGFFARMGLTLTDAQAAAAAGPLGSASAKTADLLPLIAQLVDAIAAENTGAIATKGVEAIAKAVQVIDGFSSLGSALSGAGGLSGAQVAKRIFDHLAFEYLENLEGLNDVLQLLGILDREDHDGDPDDPADPAFTVSAYHLDRIGGWLSDPASEVRNLYGWGGNSFDGAELFGRIEEIVARAGLPVIFDETGPKPKLDLVFFEAAATDDTPRGLFLRLKSNVASGVQTIPMGSEVSLKLKADFQPPNNTGLVIRPDGSLRFEPPAPGPAFSGELSLALVAKKTSPPEPFLLFGQAGGSRLELAEFTFSTGTRVTASGGAAVGEFSLGAEAKGLKAVIDLTSADGFLAKILPGTKTEASFDLRMGVSSEAGFYFGGSSALEIQIPLHVELGPVSIEALTLGAGLKDGKIPVSAGISLRAALGPLVAVVENVGVETTLSFPPGNSGNLGPLQLDVGFKPPNGVGLSIDAGVVQGGGYLFIDVDRGEYAGVLELTFSGIIAVKAIGLITTKMPDGSKGFSLLILISVEFGTAIQLGFGFTLLAVGGLLGLNRTMKLQPLMEGVRTGAIDSIMFPQDVVANAPKILSDLRAIFPPQEGIFLIGPMAKLGWGTPTLISVALGVIIEIPGNIAILGVLKVALPTEDAALIRLQVNFAGAIEFDKKRIYFFAALFESRVVFLTIEGEMGLLVAFGGDANFVVSVGGFHPRFNPPPLPIPTPRRIAVSLLSSPVARVRIEGYFAVTSNTVQFGARVEIFFGFSALNVQGHLAFDALFQFSPFFFVIEISASFSVKVFGAGLFSVRLRGALEGPTPWRVQGEGEISILFIDVSVDVDHTWGESRDTLLPPIAVMPLLEAEFNKDDNWRALLPAGNNLLVTLRKLPAEEAALVLHPIGVLRVSQRALPLDLKLDKVGTQKPSDVNRLSVVVSGGGLAKKADAIEQFAPAQFQNFNDGDKLSRPAFGPEHAGLDLSAAGEDLRSSAMVKRVVRYEEIIIDSNFKRFARRFRGYLGSLFVFFLGGGSIAKSELSQVKKKQLQPFADKIEVGPETYTVALQASNKAYSAATVSFASEAAARDFLEREARKDPNLAETLHVIPSSERAA